MTTSCPYCGATGERIYERGRGTGFIRFRCKDCLGEFDVDPPTPTTGAGRGLPPVGRP